MKHHAAFYFNVLSCSLPLSYILHSVPAGHLVAVSNYFVGQPLWVLFFPVLQSVLNSRWPVLISPLWQYPSSRCHFSVSFTFPFKLRIIHSSKCFPFSFTKVALGVSGGICPRPSFWRHKDRGHKVGLKKQRLLLDTIDNLIQDSSSPQRSLKWIGYLYEGGCQNYRHIVPQYRVLSKHILCRISPEQATENHIIVANLLLFQLHIAWIPQLQ